MSIRFFSLALLVFPLTALAPAQTTAAVPMSAPHQVAPTAGIEDIVNRYQHEILSVAQAMPAEKYGFSPASLNIPGANFGKVRTFAEELKHVAQANYAIASNITGGEPAANSKTVATLEHKDDIIAALLASFTAVHAAIATITPANQNDVVDDSGVGPHQSKLSEAAWVGAHGYDHYGQLVEYLRMNGIVPTP